MHKKKRPEGRFLCLVLAVVGRTFLLPVPLLEGLGTTVFEVGVKGVDSVNLPFPSNTIVR